VPAIATTLLTEVRVLAEPGKCLPTMAMPSKLETIDDGLSVGQR